MKSKGQKIKAVVKKHGLEIDDAIKELIKEGLVVTKSEAKRQYFLCRGVE